MRRNAHKAGFRPTRSMASASPLGGRRRAPSGIARNSRPIQRSGRELQFHLESGAGGEGDEYVQAELIPLAAHQIGDARLPDLSRSAASV
jgi:hypothetical protein